MNDDPSPPDVPRAAATAARAVGCLAPVVAARIRFVRQLEKLRGNLSLLRVIRVNLLVLHAHVVVVILVILIHVVVVIPTHEARSTGIQTRHRALPAVPRVAHAIARDDALVFILRRSGGPGPGPRGSARLLLRLLGGLFRREGVLQRLIRRLKEQRRRRALRVLPRARAREHVGVRGSSRKPSRMH